MRTFVLESASWSLDSLRLHIASWYQTDRGFSARPQREFKIRGIRMSLPTISSLPLFSLPTFMFSQNPDWIRFLIFSYFDHDGLQRNRWPGYRIVSGCRWGSYRRERKQHTRIVGLCVQGSETSSTWLLHVYWLPLARIRGKLHFLNSKPIILWLAITKTKIMRAMQTTFFLKYKLAKLNRLLFKMEQTNSHHLHIRQRWYISQANPGAWTLKTL